jgi:hypothetical protein
MTNVPAYFPIPGLMLLKSVLSLVVEHLKSGFADRRQQFVLVVGGRAQSRIA